MGAVDCGNGERVGASSRTEKKGTYSRTRGGGVRKGSHVIGAESAVLGGGGGGWGGGGGGGFLLLGEGQFAGLALRMGHCSVLKVRW